MFVLAEENHYSWIIANLALNSCSDSLWVKFIWNTQSQSFGIIFIKNNQLGEKAQCFGQIAYIWDLAALVLCWKAFFVLRSYFLFTNKLGISCFEIEIQNSFKNARVIVKNVMGWSLCTKFILEIEEIKEKENGRPLDCRMEIEAGCGVNHTTE